MVKWLEGEQLCYDDVLIVPQFSDIKSRADIALDDGFHRLKLPVIASNMDTITEGKMMLAMMRAGGLGILHRNMEPRKTINIAGQIRTHSGEHENLPICISTGLLNTPGEKARIDLILKSFEGQVWICVDVAHGHTLTTADTIKYIKDRSPRTFVIAGNIATGAGAVFLAEAGADAIRANVGSGSGCSTRVKTGCGLPGLATILDVKATLDEYDKHPYIIADGGIRGANDAAKAIASGAHAIMLGGMLAGTDCTPKWIREGELLEYRGMASYDAKLAAGKDPANVEGASFKVLAKSEGSTVQVLNNIAEGLRSAMSYTGAKNITEFKDKAILARVSAASIKENHPHFMESFK